MQKRIREITTVEFYRNEKFAIAKKMEGGMGTVYQLIPINSSSPVIALKTIQASMQVRDFDIECEAWLSVAHHENIARAFTFGNWSGVPAILIDWYPRALADVKIDECTNEFIIDIFNGLVRGLNFAHSESGLIHQDIKPANVLLDSNDNPRLADFGLARCLSSATKSEASLNFGSLSKITNGRISGTPFYMAPELFHGGRPSISSDIFSLGVSFYQLLTGEHPYIETTPTPRVLNEMRTEPLKKMMVARGKQIFSLVDAIVRCIAIDPSSRFKSYSEINVGESQRSRRRSDSEQKLIKSLGASGKAALFSSRGETSRAEQFLMEQLSADNSNVVLLNAMAELKTAEGANVEAAKIYTKAFKILKGTRGQFLDTFFPEPALAHARNNIRLGNYVEASSVLRDILSWAPSSTSGNAKSVSYFEQNCFPEIGWLFLFDGEFQRASNYLQRTISQKNVEKAPLAWLLESSWLADNLWECADSIARKYLQIRSSLFKSIDDFDAAWSLLLLRDFANPILSNEIWKSLPPQTFKETLAREKEAGLTQGSFLLGGHFEAQKYLITEIDKLNSGGKHFGHIQQISQQRLA